MSESSERGYHHRIVVWNIGRGSQDLLRQLLDLLPPKETANTQLLATAPMANREAWALSQSGSVLLLR